MVVIMNDGITRLEEMLQEQQDNALTQIVNHLKKLKNVDTTIFLKEEKNLKDMMQYITEQAKNKAFNNVAVIEDTQVYEWAVNYFSKGNDELGINEQTTQINPLTKTIKTIKNEDKITKNDEKVSNQLSLGF